MNLVLIGYRGTGKTTVARVLAERLKWPWFDSDERIEHFHSKSIAEIFAQEGERAFRVHESSVVRQLALVPDCILALGGGAVLCEDSRRSLAEQGTIIWLTAPPEVLWERISADRETALRRPNLTREGGTTEIIATLAARETIYRQCAAHVVDTTGKTPAEVADAILAQVRIPR